MATRVGCREIEEKMTSAVVLTDFAPCLLPEAGSRRKEGATHMAFPLAKPVSPLARESILAACGAAPLSFSTHPSMADTIQLVQWSLDQACRLRPAYDPEDLAAPSPSRQALACIQEVRSYENGKRNHSHGFGVYGDVCVTMVSHGARPLVDGKKVRGNSSPMVPTHGFIISQSFAPCGGIAAIDKMCGACPANTRPARMAHCAGTLNQHPNSPETEEQLRGIISRLGLAEEMAAAFPATTPIWYGLWAVSPVPVKSLPLLGLLLQEMLAEDRREMELRMEIDHEQIEDFSEIIEAIARAEKHGIPLHVELLPLGHTDFGRYTIFPHCPLCKATARTERWQHQYPCELQTCRVCGTRFSPAETSSSAPMKWPGDDRDLKKQLGAEGYRRFIAEHLLACGEAPAEIEGIIAATEAEEKEREEKWRQQREQERRNAEFIERHVFHGLQRLEPPRDADEDDEEVEEDDDDGAPGPAWFGAEDLAEVLRRCEAMGIRITYLCHLSRETKKFRSAMPGRKEGTAREILEKWRAEGCDEKFQVICRAPKELLDEP